MVCENCKGRSLVSACHSSKNIAMVNHANPILKMLSLSNDEVKFSSEPAKYKGRRRIFIVTGSLLVYVRACDTAQSIYNALATFGKKKWDLDWAQPVEDLVKVDEVLSAPSTERINRRSFNRPLMASIFGMFSRSVTIAAVPLLARRYSNASSPNNVNKGTAMRPAL